MPQESFLGFQRNCECKFQNNSIFGLKQVFLSLHLLFFIEQDEEFANDEGKNHDKVIKQLKVNFKALMGAN